MHGLVFPNLCKSLPMKKDHSKGLITAMQDLQLFPPTEEREKGLLNKKSNPAWNLQQASGKRMKLREQGCRHTSW